MIEFTLVLPTLVILFFGAYSFWTNFQQAQVYSKAAQSLAEWIGRSGYYTTNMRDTIRAQIDAAAAVKSSTSYLYVFVTKPDTSTIEVGIPGGVPAVAVGNPPSPPANTGWNSTAAIAGLPSATQIQVDIWGYYQIAIPLLPISTWSIPLGHAVFYAVTGN